jgi:hypothetical protein
MNFNQVADSPCVLHTCACSPNRYITPVVTRVANLVLELPENAAGAAHMQRAGLQRICQILAVH